MIDKSNSRPLLAQLKAALNKWRVAFLILALIYFVVLLLLLSNQPMNWDEVTRLTGAMELKHGLYNNFVRDSFYPPLYSVFTTVSFDLFGASLFSARLVSAVFSILSLWVVFELAYSLYGRKAALISAVLLAIMPGYFWLSRLALLEIMLVFFFTLSLFFFYRWLISRKNWMLVFSGLALGFGFLTKYQVVAAVAVMVVSMLILGWGQLKRLFSRFTILIVAALAVIVPWLLIVYHVLASYVWSQWMYALQMGNPGRSLYSVRFPIPIFYLIEMTWPYSDVHPVSLLLYIVGLTGLGLFVWRRKREDKFVFVWFISVFVFFTLISNREWRYVLTLFPALAISASVLVLFVYDKLHNTWMHSVKINRKKAAKVAAASLIIFMSVAMANSIYDIYYNVKQNDINIEIGQATSYALAHDPSNQSIILLCPYNYFSQDMVSFYLWADGAPQIRTYQYPALPVDTYTPTFNLTEFIGLCRQDNVKFVFMYEYGATVPYFNTTLNLHQVYEQIYYSGNFSGISDQATFGANPRRIFILNFTG
ncbi:MAG: glycosyltransferase family 39 protein [Candidatus Bathyarchaeia archaeon]|jgi:4-amino-4-deoxy-L-arabinose transferase-like glycosyltransferase